MKRTIEFGKIDYMGRGRKDCLVTVEIEIRQRGGEKTFTINPATKERVYTGKTTPIYNELSICGNIWNHRHTDIYCGGQCLDTIAEYIHTPLFQELYKYWKLYHLNGMHPECEHQETAGWTETAKKEVELYTFTLTPETLKRQKEIEGMAIESAKRGEPFRTTIKQRYILALDYSITAHNKELPDHQKEFYTLKKTEKKLLGWLRESEHPDGILCKPCPVCGYKYGTEWKHRDIPADVLARIYEIIEN